MFQRPLDGELALVLAWVMPNEAIARLLMQQSFDFRFDGSVQLLTELFHLTLQLRNYRGFLVSWRFILFAHLPSSIGEWADNHRGVWGHGFSAHLISALSASLASNSHASLPLL